MKKKMFFALLVSGMLLNNVQMQAQEDIKIYVDGMQLSLDTQPVQKNNRTLVPFRAISDSLGAEVSWDGGKKSVICKKDGNTLVLAVDSDIMLKNGNAIRLDTTPVISNGRVLVPVRALSEGFGAAVNWYSVERIISIRTDLSSETDISDNDKIETADIEMEHSRKEYADSKGNLIFIYDCTVPKVANSGAVADKINSSIASNVDYYFEMGAEDFRQEAELAADIANSQHTKISPYSLTGSTEVTYNQNGILSLVISYTVQGCDFDCDGWKTNRLIMPLVYNTNTGELMELGDMVSEKAVTKAKSGIISIIKKNENGCYDDYVSRIQSKNPKFYVTDKGITFVYDAGYLKNASKGDVRYSMTFSELEK